MQLLLKAGGHQNSVVHGSAQLHAADDGGSNEGRGGPGKVAEALIEKNGQLNRGHQHRRNGNGLERPCHDEENAGDGKVVRHHKVHGGGVDEVAVHGALAGDHGVLIVFFQNGVHFVQLAGNGVGSGLVAGVDHHELIAALLEHILHGVRDEEIRDAGPQYFVVGDHRGDVLELLHPGLNI